MSMAHRAGTKEPKRYFEIFLTVKTEFWRYNLTNDIDNIWAVPKPCQHLASTKPEPLCWRKFRLDN